MKSLSKCFLIIFPALFVFGCLRMMAHLFVPSTPFLPTPQEFISVFTNMPDFLGGVRNAFSSFAKVGLFFTSGADRISDAVNQMSAAWSSVSELVSFFKALGQTFSFIGQMYLVTFQFIAGFFSAVWSVIYFLYQLLKLGVVAILWVLGSLCGFDMGGLTAAFN